MTACPGPPLPSCSLQQSIRRYSENPRNSGPPAGAIHPPRCGDPQPPKGPLLGILAAACRCGSGLLSSASDCWAVCLPWGSPRAMLTALQVFKNNLSGLTKYHVSHDSISSLLSLLLTPFQMCPNWLCPLQGRHFLVNAELPHSVEASVHTFHRLTSCRAASPLKETRFSGFSGIYPCPFLQPLQWTPPQTKTLLLRPTWRSMC